MFECVSRGTLCDKTCADCPRRLFDPPKTREELEEALRAYTKSIGVDVPIYFIDLASAELAKDWVKVMERLEGQKLTNAASSAPVGMLRLPANRKEAPCANCGPVNGAAHVGLCATCAAFIDFDPDVGT
jgi:hypothetical protein